jgi:hypothetical protein
MVYGSISYAAPFFSLFSPLGTEIDAAIYRIIFRSSGIVIRENEWG